MDMTGNSPTPRGSLEDFAAQVAHDFNNLLTGILGNLELLQYRAERNNITGLNGYLEGATSAGNRAAAFTHRLLAFSGRDAQPGERVAVDELLRRVTCNATRRLDAGDAVVLCDPAQLELAITELLENAAAATHSRGAVTLSSALDGQHVVIRIRDTGHGMAAAVLARATEPFFTTQTSSAGRGLGLSIVARIAAQAGGTMQIDSTEGAGSTVTLRLPKTKL